MELLNKYLNFFIYLPETIPNFTLAQHVHNDGIELLGEIGVLGFNFMQ